MQLVNPFMKLTRDRHLAAFIAGQARALTNMKGRVMRLTVFAGVLLASIAAPLAAQAQGVPGGAAHGFQEGGRIAGPVGAVVGTAVGGVIGGVEGVLGVNQRPVAYSYGEDVPPVVVRHKVRRHYVTRHRVRHHARRVYRGAQPGTVQ
jgi:hypothetical protein